MEIKRLDDLIEYCQKFVEQTNNIFISTNILNIIRELTDIRKEISLPRNVAIRKSEELENLKDNNTNNTIPMVPSSSDIDYKYFPSNKQELRNILGQLIAERGNEGDFNDVFTGDVEDFSCIFQNRSKFNGDISKWDVSNGVDFHNMFLNTPLFNGDLSNWNIKPNANISGMFAKSGDNVKKPSVCVNI